MFASAAPGGDDRSVEYVVLCTVALVCAGLGLFTGFGLGTVLMPVMALFVPVAAAVSATAVVHFANNLFKLALLGRYADRLVVVRFALPAMVAAAGGAWLLGRLAGGEPLATYALLGHMCRVTPAGLVVGSLIAVFAVVELLRPGQRIHVRPRHLVIGGLLSGFFGGLSGHQGALRAAVLINCGLSKEAFVGTSVVASCLVDVTRISVYVWQWLVAGTPRESGLQEHVGPLAAAIAAAVTGSYIGTRLLPRVRLTQIRALIGLALAALGLALAGGVLHA